MKKLVLSLAFVSCTFFMSHAQKNQLLYENTQGRISSESTMNTYVQPLTVELEVIKNLRLAQGTQTIDGRVTLTYARDAEWVEKTMRGEMSEIRSWAVFQACKDCSADVILVPTFSFSNNRDNMGNIIDGYQITIVGFPAKFINWKTATPADYEWIKMEQTQTTDERENLRAIIK
ncbi:MAG: hypothetical protein E7081_08335 [Bacteroidales bacterium]|nr:hypothetical protein [Bacteroidales bacterium]